MIESSILNLLKIKHLYSVFMYSLLGAATLSPVKFHPTDSVVAILLMRNPKLLFLAGKLQSRI